MVPFRTFVCKSFHFAYSLQYLLTPKKCSFIQPKSRIVLIKDLALIKSLILFIIQSCRLISILTFDKKIFVFRAIIYTCIIFRMFFDKYLHINNFSFISNVFKPILSSFHNTCNYYLVLFFRTFHHTFTHFIFFKRQLNNSLFYLYFTHTRHIIIFSPIIHRGLIRQNELKVTFFNSYATIQRYK